jgi:hypothetical protein
VRERSGTTGKVVAARFNGAQVPESIPREGVGPGASYFSLGRLAKGYGRRIPGLFRARGVRAAARAALGIGPRAPLGTGPA